MPGASKRHSTPHTSQHLALDTLRTRIFEGTLPPGTPISVHQVAAELDVPPVAALLAVTHLMMRGLVINTAGHDDFDLRVVTATQTEGDDALRTLQGLTARLTDGSPAQGERCGRLIRTLVGNTAPDTAYALSDALTQAAATNPAAGATAADVESWDGLLFVARFARRCDIIAAETEEQIKVVTDTLREAIFAGTHTPGGALTPTALAATYDVPREHISAALSMLEDTGLVITSTGVHRVIDPTLAQCQDAVTLLEMMASVLAADDTELACLTDTIHHAIGTTDVQARELLEFTLRDATGRSTPRRFSSACLQGLDGLIYRTTRATSATEKKS